MLNNKRRYGFLILLVTLMNISHVFSQTPSNKEFVEIFDGQTLDNWKGDSTYWHVENGCIQGTITPETILKSNTFIVWQGGQPSDFELQLEYRISESGNSGINYRSTYVKDKPYALRGYQCDIDGKNKYTGQNYEEKKRTTLAYRGEKVLLSTPEDPEVIENIRNNVNKNCWQTREVLRQLGESETLNSKIKKNDWNQVHLIIKGNRLLHYINGTLMSDVTDNDSIHKVINGYIGVQVHVGPPMKVEYRNIRLKEL
ncbi:MULTISPECIES: 3-keto-disaccharide hydrolase [unclassified Saccharicrinis]|uniref:3-keto-disaccharide hydrolase n=1 Tax=unclassified Saccharicrinis TaxID=2646859 RepID=UPI003D33E046